MSEIPITYLVGYETACQMLADSTVQSCVGHVLSLGAENDLPPKQLHTLSWNALRLTFDDIESQTSAWYYGCSEADVQKILDWSTAVASNPLPAVIHCAAGISRSSAATMLMMATCLGPGHEDEVVARVKLVAEECYRLKLREHSAIRPNRRILWFGDHLLRLEGRLLQAAEVGFGYREPYVHDTPSNHLR